MKCVLGVDTSNYTTSMCAVSALDGQLVAEARQLVRVRQGQRGLRQSEAVFFHVQKLPYVMGMLMAQFSEQQISPEWVRVGVSIRPRPFSASYMPVFSAGASFAATFAQALKLPVSRTSHQEGHLAAAEYFVPRPRRRFVAVHISGGTSDVSVARRTAFGYHVERIGESLDLHAGQFVDRVGVLLGLPFPAGVHLERLAETAGPHSPHKLVLAAPVRGAHMSFSGPLSEATRAIQSGHSPADIAVSVQSCIARSVSKAVEFAVRNDQHEQIQHVLIAGGVASNRMVKEIVSERLGRRLPGIQIAFAPPEFARDNALGVARIAWQRINEIGV